MNAKLPALLLALALAVAFCGCQPLPPSPSEQLKLTLDEKSPDNRRKGIAYLSANDWGRKEPYLKSYATFLKNDASPAVRAQAADALGKAGDANYVPNLAAALDDQSPVVRWEVAVALTRVAGPDALGPLKKHAVEDPSDDVRMWCTYALRYYPRQDAAKVLVRCLADPNFSVQHHARQSLVYMTGEDHGYDVDAWSTATDKEIKPRSRG